MACACHQVRDGVDAGAVRDGCCISDGVIATHRIDIDDAKVWINGRRVGYHSIHPRSQVGRKEIEAGADVSKYTLCVYELHEDSFIRRNYGVTTVIKYV